MARISAAFLFLFAICSVLGQTLTSKPEFEVFDVKPSDRKSSVRTEHFSDAGQFTVRNSTLSELLPFAYRSRLENIAQMPSWLKKDRFDIVAKAPPNTNEAVVGKMLKALLVHEFKIVAHEEQRPTPVFALTAITREAKLRKSLKPGISGCSRGLSQAKCTNLTMAEFATRLPFLAPDYIDRGVVDMTDISGEYDFELIWVSNARIDELGGPTIFEALSKQFGLKLDKRTIPARTIFIDRAERPLKN